MRRRPASEEVRFLLQEEGIRPTVGSGQDELLGQTARARRDSWATWGELDDDALTHLVRPVLMGGPMWPSGRQAFRVVRRPGEVLVASDGLSDPFPPQFGNEGNGFGLEFYATTADPIGAVAGSWLWDMVWQMSQSGASRGGVAELLDELGVVPTELDGVDIPHRHRDRFVTDGGRVGVLLGIDGSSPSEAPPGRIDGPLSTIRLVNVKLLTRTELQHLREHGEPGRVDVAGRLVTQGNPRRSGLDRPSVV